MEIKNVNIYGLKESIIRSGYPHDVGEPENLTDMLDKNGDIIGGLHGTHIERRIYKLANTPIGSGHNNFLKGIIVQFDLKYPQYFTPQLQRYHWIDIISSQSKMHSLTKIKDISGNCNKYVLPQFIGYVNDLISDYNNFDEYLKHKKYKGVSLGLDNNGHSIYAYTKEELFQYIISNLPMGFELWMGISTNYLQLKTIYKQRRHHKLKEDWGYFCDWIESLPMSTLITE